MGNPANETVHQPFTAFNFAVEIRVDGVAEQVCSAAFSECDGLEMTLDVKSIREGGNNDRQIRLAGPVSYGQVTLKRGMTSTFDLWDWVAAVVGNPALRADAHIVIFAPDGKTVRVKFNLSRCLPTKLKAPALNAKDGMVAIEELQMVYESLTLERPSGGGETGAGAPAGTGGGPGIGISASAGVGGAGGSATLGF